MSATMQATDTSTMNIHIINPPLTFNCPNKLYCSREAIVIANKSATCVSYLRPSCVLSIWIMGIVSVDSKTFVSNHNRINLNVNN